MKILKSGFIIAEAIIYTTYMIMDITELRSDITSVLKLAGVVLCMGMALALCLENATEDRRLMLAAMLFTLGADVILLFTDYYSVGVSLFCIVQTSYLFWLQRLNNRIPRVGELVDRSMRSRSILKSFIIVLGLRIAAAIIIALAVLSVVKLDLLLTVIVAFYAFSFLDNVRRAVFMLITKRHERSGLYFGLLAAGLIAFLLCDINVGLVNASRQFPAAAEALKGVYGFAVLGMWLFYLPAQVMLVMSVSDKRK